MHIAVAGGTGLIGRMVMDEVERRGDTAAVLARSAGVDLVAGSGIETALAGAEAVIDVSNVVTTSRDRSVEFFDAAGTNLRAAAERVGVRHLVCLSIVGIDRVGWGYYFGKRRQEEIALSGTVPATVLRATQFHEFADQLLQRGGPVALVPKILSQPIAAREVAAALVELARGPAQGLLPDMAGPAQLHMPDMVRSLLRARGSRRPVLALRVPGAAGKALATGGLLPTGDGARGRQTYAAWLEAETRTAGAT